MYTSIPAALFVASHLLSGVSAVSNLPPIERSLRHKDLAARAIGDDGLAARSTLTAKGTSDDVSGTFVLVGDSGVSAQMMFLGTNATVFILDKTENNSMTVTTPSGVTHPAWGTSYDLASNTATPMEVTSNTFCAGGFAMANGSWVVFGGNQPVTYGGVAVNDKTNNPTGADPYDDLDGGAAIRMLDPCDDPSTCGWQEGLTMSVSAQLFTHLSPAHHPPQSKRWYPMVEGLADGSLIVLGGDTNGGYVSTFVQNNPTYEYFPKQSSGSIPMAFLNYTVPVNLFPLTWLLPSGKLFLQAAYKSILYDMDTRIETPLQDMPYAVRVYPGQRLFLNIVTIDLTLDPLASAAAVMLPLTPDNNYTATIVFCGGSSANFNQSSDGGAGFNVTAVAADSTCVRISPDDANPTYEDDDSLPEGRSMGQLIYLPDGTMWLGNGVAMGTAGYGNEKYSIGQSYGQDPIYSPAIYDPSAPSGSRFNRDGLSDSLQERMYHSTAILLADGSILVSGSNPNEDFTTAQWSTNYAVERWYPLWYNAPRPVVTSSWPSSLSYGGDYWNLTFTNATADPSNAKVVVIRTGFSTHCMNFGQRYLELSTSYTKDQTSGDITLHVSQMPPNANVFQPGPAMIYLVVDGIPSQGEMLLIGSGQIETQPLLAAATLPTSQLIQASNGTSDSSTGGGNITTSSSSTSAGSDAAKSGALSRVDATMIGAGIIAVVSFAVFGQ
ncbi:hypothetical protein P7C73_g3648, partial [Tremellales sp. Uapishka_1]